jgi:hypothetical protein
VANRKSKRMTLDELRQTREFQKLAPKMAMWVSSYVGTIIDGDPDPAFATRSAYQCMKPEAFRVFGYQMLAKKQVQVVLALFVNSGKTKRQIQLEEIDKHLAAVKPGSKAAQELLAMKVSLGRKKS